MQHPPNSASSKTAPPKSASGKLVAEQSAPAQPLHQPSGVQPNQVAGALGYGYSQIYKDNQFFQDGMYGASQTEANSSFWRVDLVATFSKNGSQQRSYSNNGSGSIGWTSDFIPGTSSDTFNEHGLHGITTNNGDQATCVTDLNAHP